MVLHGMCLLLLGRAEGPGIHRGLNQLLKSWIESPVAPCERTLIDGEAGVEQINRRVVDSLCAPSRPTGQFG